MTANTVAPLLETLDHCPDCGAESTHCLCEKHDEFGNPL